MDTPYDLKIIKNNLENVFFFIINNYDMLVWLMLNDINLTFMEEVAFLRVSNGKMCHTAIV